jgi:hypothetical protein
MRWYMKSGLLTLVSVTITVFWDVMTRSLEDRYESFRAACCLHLQGRRVKRQQVPQKQWYVPLKLHSVMNKKTPILFEIWLSSGTSDPDCGYTRSDVTATQSTKSTSHCSPNSALLVVLRSSVIQLLNLSKSSHDFDLLALWMKRNRTCNVAPNQQRFRRKWWLVRGIISQWGTVLSTEPHSCLRNSSPLM